MPEPSTKRNRLTQPDSAAAADGNHAVDFVVAVVLLEVGERFRGGGDGGVHFGFGEDKDVGDGGREEGLEGFGEVGLAWCCDYEGGGPVFYFRGQVLETAAPEDNAGWVGVVLKCLHICCCCCWLLVLEGEVVGVSVRRARLLHVC